MQRIIDRFYVSDNNISYYLIKMLLVSNIYNGHCFKYISLYLASLNMHICENALNALGIGVIQTRII